MSSILKWRDYISNPNTICCLRIINLLDWVQGNLSSIYFFYFSIFHSVRSAEQFFINYLKVYSLFDVYSTFCILLLVGIKRNISSHSSIIVCKHCRASFTLEPFFMDEMSWWNHSRDSLLIVPLIVRKKPRCRYKNWILSDVEHPMPLSTILKTNLSTLFRFGLTQYGKFWSEMLP